MPHNVNTEASDRSFVFLAGSIWLDFVNTQVMGDDGVADLLHHSDDFRHWAEDAGLCEKDSGTGVSKKSDTGLKGGDVLDQVKSFRAELRKQAERFAAGHLASDAFVQRLNDRLAAGPRRAAVNRTRDGFDLRFALAGSIDTSALLSLIAESAAHYLVHGQASRLKTCEDNGCILFFYDTSKNNARRWCSMATCGNRAKAKAHYARTRRPPSE